MRIAVISLKVNANYGGILQAWALQKTLTQMGHEVVLIDGPDPKDLSLWQAAFKYPWRAFRKRFLHSTKPIRHERIVAEDFLRHMKNVLPFIDRHIKRRFVNGIGDIQRGEYDAIVFGSDQVWRPAYARYFLGQKMENMFGYFAKDWPETMLAAYAASFGIDNLGEYTQKEKDAIAEVLPKFKGISVREKSGVALCNRLGAEAVNVIDPTLLFSKRDYLQLIDQADCAVLPHHGIMTYILDASEDADEIVDRISQLKKLPVFSTLPKPGETPEGVEQWLAGFRDAEMIVTDSFHACVFAIIFQKPFAVLSNPARGTARIDSLLSAFGLECNRIKSIPSSLDGIKTPGADTAERLQQLRHTALGFLKSTIGLA